MLEILDLPPGLHFSDASALVATWFGAGLVSPLRAGLAVATALLIAVLLQQRLRLAGVAVLVALSGAAAIGAWEATTGTHDDRRIVVDEVLGFLVAACLLSAATWRMLLLATPLFLAVDRWKPWPIDRLEALPGPIGVLADDVAVGLAVGALALAGYTIGCGSGAAKKR